MATTIEEVILSISADTAQINRAMQRLTGDIKQSTKTIEGEWTRVDNAVKRTTQTIQQGGQQMTTSVRQVRAQTANLGFQLNDISQGLMSGTSPFTLMVQQGSQVSQVLQNIGGARAGLAAIGGAFMQMVHPVNLLVMGLIYAAGYVTKYFTAADEGADKAADAFKKQIDALDGLNKKFEDFLSASTQDVLADIIDEQAIEEQVMRMEGIITALRERFTTAFGKLDLPELNWAESLGYDDAKKIADSFLIDWLALIDAVATGEDPLEKVNALIAQLDAIELKAPEKGAGDFADTLRSKLLPTLERIIDREKAIAELRGQTNRVGREAIEQQKEYNKAMDELRKAVDGPLTEAERILRAHKTAIDSATTSMRGYVNATGLLNIAMTDMADEAVGKLGSSLSGLDEYTQKVIQVEGGGSLDPLQKNIAGTSNAFGPFQFIPSTFVSMVKSLDGFSNASAELILAQKGNLDLQRRAFDELTRQNSAALAKAGIPVTDATRYLAHFLGSAGAVKMLQAAPGASAAAVAGKQAAAANVTVLGGGKTVQDVIDWAERKMGGAGAQLSTKAIREETEALREDARARGELGSAIDAETAKREEQLKFNELMRDSRRKAAEEGRVISEEEIKVNRERAAEYGRLQGQVAAQKALTTGNEAIDARIQALKDETAALQLAAQQSGVSSQALDQERVAREAAVEVLKIENQLRSQGITLTAAQRAALETTVTANINAKNAARDFTVSQRDSVRAAQEFAGLAKDFLSGFISDMREGKSATEALANALGRLGDRLLDMSLDLLFSNLFKGIGGVTAAAGGTVGLSRHTDGRRFPAAMWAGAPHYQQGGMVGRLRPGEVPIIAHKGELIIPKSGLRRGSAGGQQPTTITNNSDIAIDMSQAGVVANGNDAKALGEMIRRSTEMILVRESRPGGLLRQAGATR